MAGPHGSGAITSGHSPAESRPLEGVRVLDLTRLLPGAYATLMLADLGADVIKIEDPRSGDQSRHMPPLVNGTSVYFTVLNRNKRSVTLNLRAPTAAAILDRCWPVRTSSWTAFGRGQRHVLESMLRRSGGTIPR